MIFLVVVVAVFSGCGDDVVVSSGDVSVEARGVGFGGDVELGVYEVCADVSSCDVDAGLDRILDAGGDAVIVTAADENYAYYDSSYLPSASWVPSGYLTDVVEGAHERGMRVYALVYMPHGYWLSMHPDDISVLSDGHDSDHYSDDYFQRIVPPARVVSDAEYLLLIEGIFSEVRSVGFDGIDLNDNFQWAEWYFSDSDVTLYSSYDEVTLGLFMDEAGFFVPSGDAAFRASYIEENLWDEWVLFRARKVTELLSVLDGFSGDVPFRPHLIFNEWVYEDFGLDYAEISDVVDSLYIMKTDEYSDYPSGGFYGSVYVDNDGLDDALGMADAGALGVYVFDYGLIEERGLWDEVASVFSSVRGR